MDSSNQRRSGKNAGMKMSCEVCRPRLSLALVFVLAWAGNAVAQTVLIDANFSDSTEGQAPATVKYASPPVKLPQAVRADGKNLAVVVDAVGSLKDKPLKLEKADGANPRTPAIRFFEKSGAVTGGRLRIEFDAVIERYKAGPKFPGFERLVTLNLYGDDGKVFLNAGYTVGRACDGGSIAVNDTKGGRWKLGEANHWILEVNLDSGKASVVFDGKEIVGEASLIGEKIKAVRIMEFRDGTAFGAYDGVFVAAIDNLKVVQSEAK